MAQSREIPLEQTITVNNRRNSEYLSRCRHNFWFGINVWQLISKSHSTDPQLASDLVVGGLGSNDHLTSTIDSEIYTSSYRICFFGPGKPTTVLGRQTLHVSALKTVVNKSASWWIFRRLYYLCQCLILCLSAHATYLYTLSYSLPEGRLRSLIGSALDHRSLPPEFISGLGHIWKVCHRWLRFIIFGGGLAHLAYHVHKSGRKTSIIIISTDSLPEWFMPTNNLQRPVI